MKKVIVRLRDCRVNTIKTLKKRCYYTQSQYQYEVYEDFKSLMPGQEIWIKFGNMHELYITYENVMSNAEFNERDFDSELSHELVSGMWVEYFLKQYLPQY